MFSRCVHSTRAPRLQVCVCEDEHAQSVAHLIRACRHPDHDVVPENTPVTTECAMRVQPVLVVNVHPIAIVRDLQQGRWKRATDGVMQSMQDSECEA